MSSDVGRLFEHEALLDVELYALGVAVLFDESVQRVAGRHPLDESAVGTERHDCVAHNAQLGAGRAAVELQERVDHSEQLHHALVLAQVLVPFQQERVLSPVAAHYAQSTGMLLAVDDAERCVEAADADDGRRGRVAARHSQLQVVRTKQPRRHLRQLNVLLRLHALVDRAEHV